MRVLLVITDADFYEHTGYADAWERALRDQGAEVERLAGPPASWATEPPDPGRWDLAIAHVLVEEVVAFAPTLRLAALLETWGVPLLNPVASILTTSDKLATHAAWAAQGVPQPRTHDLAALDDWPAAPGTRLVLKPSSSDGARHIVEVTDLHQARRHVEHWRADERDGGEQRGAALLQERVDDPRVIRLFATPATVSPAYEKHREPGEIVTHGTTYPTVYAAPDELAALARRMVATLGAGLLGVDVLVDQDGRHLALEANAPFGFDVTDPEQGAFVARQALEKARRPAPALAE